MPPRRRGEEDTVNVSDRYYVYVYIDPRNLEELSRSLSLRSYRRRG